VLLGTYSYISQNSRAVYTTTLQYTIWLDALVLRQWKSAETQRRYFSIVHSPISQLKDSMRKYKKTIITMITRFIQAVWITGVRAVWKTACWFTHWQRQTIFRSCARFTTRVAYSSSMKTCAAWLRLWRLLLSGAQRWAWSSKTTSSWLCSTAHHCHRWLSAADRWRCTSRGTVASTSWWLTSAVSRSTRV